MVLWADPIGKCVQYIFIGQGILGNKFTSKVQASKDQTTIFSFPSTITRSSVWGNLNLLEASLQLLEVTSEPLMLTMLFGILEMHYYLSMLNNPFVGEDIMIDQPSSLIVVSLGYSTSYSESWSEV